MIFYNNQYHVCCFYNYRKVKKPFHLLMQLELQCYLVLAHSCM